MRRFCSFGQSVVLIATSASRAQSSSGLGGSGGGGGSGEVGAGQASGSAEAAAAAAEEAELTMERATTTRRPDAASLVAQMEREAIPHPHLDGSPMAPATVEYDETVPYTEEDRLIEMVEQKARDKIALNNSKLSFPTHPSKLIPRYERIGKKKRLYRFDEEFPMIPRKDNWIALPPPKQHPWVEGQPIGPNIIHGDGQQRIAGHGEVGFEDDQVPRNYPKEWKGFQRITSVGMVPPELNGDIDRDAVVVKHSLQLSGKGYFATRDIKKGEKIMVLSTKTVNLGFNAEIDRLCELTCDVLAKAYEGGAEQKAFLHQWVLTGQCSNMLERWPADATNKVIEDVGGIEILDALELHRHHVARIASILDLNAFLIENYYNERKGMAYWPEAQLFNHSCCPNVDYEIMPSHMFAESKWCPKTETLETGEYSEMTPEQQQQAGVKGAASSVITMENMAELEADLVDSPTYLFCCEANRDIQAGEELLIAYVPPEWRYEDRQYVLHDRYRFWCKCPKCATTLDYDLRGFPRLMLGIIIVYFLVQLLVYRARESTVGRWDDIIDAQKKGTWAMVDEDRYIN